MLLCVKHLWQLLYERIYFAVQILKPPALANYLASVLVHGPQMMSCMIAKTKFCSVLKFIFIYKQIAERSPSNYIQLANAKRRYFNFKLIEVTTLTIAKCWCCMLSSCTFTKFSFCFYSLIYACKLMQGNQSSQEL